MKKILKELGIMFLLGLGSVIIWAIYLFVSSDIPVSIQWYEFVLMLMLLFTFVVNAIVTIRSSKYPYFGLFFLTIPTLLWLISAVNDLTYQYHHYATITSTLGFVIGINLLMYSLYQLISKASKRKKEKLKTKKQKTSV